MPASRDPLPVRLAGTPGTASVRPVGASFVQQRLWFLDQLYPHSAAYNLYSAFRLTGPLVPGALADALNTIIARHGSLRTTFSEGPGGACQIVAPALRIDVPVHEYANEAAAQQAFAHDAAIPFDLRTGPLIRASLGRIAPETHLLLLVIHHVVADGWSMSVLFQELAALYVVHHPTAGRGQIGERSGAPPAQYADYAEWQRTRHRQGAFDKGLAFWQQALADGAAVLDVPTDRPRPSHPTFRGGTVRFKTSPEVTVALKKVGRSEGASPFMTVAAALAVLLRRYSGEAAVSLGTPMANRLRLEDEETIGFFANTLVLRCDLADNPTFRSLLRRVRDVTVAALALQDTPFEQVVERLNPTRDLSVNPLFQVMLALQLADPPMRLLDVGVEPLVIHNGTSKFDLLFEMRDHGDYFDAQIEFNSDIFDESTIVAMRRAFLVLLAALAADPARPIDEYRLVDESDLARVRHQADAAVVDFGEDLTVVDLVAAQTARQPQATALVHGPRTMDYATLRRHAARLATRLRARGIGPDQPVALCVDRSCELIVGLLGILEAGAAYLPLDPAYPPDRLRMMVDDAGARVVVTQRSRAGAGLFANVEIECVDDLAGGSVDTADSREDGRDEVGEEASPLACVDPDSLAYVIYTSGSTGRPKGIAMPHRPLCNLVRWQMARGQATVGTPTLQFAPISFDVSFQEIFSTLGSGGTLVLLDDEERRDPSALLARLNEAGVERLFVPFVALQQLADTVEREGRLPARLREVITAGEQLVCTPSVVRMFSALGGCTLDNQYGPSETHVVTAYRLEGPPDTWPLLPPIGRAIANVDIQIRDHALQPVPAGMPGELCVGGVALARGYLGRPEETRARFVCDPVAPSRRLYRTGDKARARTGGDIDFLGRLDQQVKIRGYRVEPGEIETVLSSHPAVREAAVVLVQAGSGARRLAAYVVPARDEGPLADDLRRFAATRLPEYMVPSFFVLVPALPLTPSGKLDRRALPPPAQEAGTRDTTAGRDRVERALQAIWREALGVASVGVEDDFFALGGHSLLAAEVCGRIGRTFDLSLPVSVLFRARTVAQLASVIRDQRKVSAECIVLLNDVPAGDRPPLFLVHSLGGSVFDYHDLARHLAPWLRVYGVQAVLDDDVPAWATSIRETAASYVCAVQERQPRGPYLLGGWSSGGTIALEMAQQLVARDESVAFVITLDSSPYNTPDARSLASTVLKLATNVPFWCVDDLIKGGGARGLASRIARRVRSTVDRVGARLRGTRALEAEVGGFLDLSVVTDAQRTFMQRQYRALREYEPRSYAGRVLLYQARTHPLLHLNDSDRAWRSLTPHLDVCVLPGTHLSIVKPPLTAAIARDLKARLQILLGASMLPTFVSTCSALAELFAFA